MSPKKVRKGGRFRAPIFVVTQFVTQIILHCLSEYLPNLGPCHLYENDQDQDDTLDRVVNQGVHLQSQDNLVYMV